VNGGGGARHSHEKRYIQYIQIYTDTYNIYIQIYTISYINTDIINLNMYKYIYKNITRLVAIMRKPRSVRKVEIDKTKNGTEQVH
jgi:hypothetical protein